MNKREIFDNFNELIAEDPYETCMFIYSLLHERGYVYRPTGCNGEEWILRGSYGS